MSSDSILLSMMVISDSLVLYAKNTITIPYCATVVLRADLSCKILDDVMHKLNVGVSAGGDPGGSGICVLTPKGHVIF